MTIPSVGAHVGRLDLVTVPGQGLSVRVGPWPGGLPAGTFTAHAGLDLTVDLTVTVEVDTVVVTWTGAQSAQMVDRPWRLRRAGVDVMGGWVRVAHPADVPGDLTVEVALVDGPTVPVTVIGGGGGGSVVDIDDVSGLSSALADADTALAAEVAARGDADTTLATAIATKADATIPDGYGGTRPLAADVADVRNLTAHHGPRLDETDAARGPTIWDVAPAEVLVTHAEWTAAGLENWPDGTIGRADVGGTVYGFSPQPNRTVARVDLGDLTDITIADLIPIEPADYAGGGPVVDLGGTLVMVWHGERHHPDRESPGYFWSFLGLATSTDGGVTWTDLGRIVTPAMPYGPEANVEVGGGALLVRDGQLHIYFAERAGATFPAARQLNLCVARASIAAVTAWANGGASATFTKWDGGGWTEPGLGGTPADILPASATPRWWDAIWLTDQDEGLLVYSSISDYSLDGRWALWARPLLDPTTPGPAQRLSDEGTAETLYVTLTDPDDRAAQTVTGDTVELLYTRSAAGWADPQAGRWSDAELMTRTLTRHPAGQDGVEEWQPVGALANGWVVADPTQLAPAYYRDGHRGHLRLPPMTGGASGAPAFTLPATHRPAEIAVDFVPATTDGSSFAGGSVVVAADGSVSLTYAPGFPVLFQTTFSWRIP